MQAQAPKEIGRLSFGLMDPEEYREMSATKVITADTYDDDGFPIDMGLMDPRLGVIDPGLECKTCGKHSGSCNGHFGHIELAQAVIHVGHAKLIRRLLRGTCRECSRLTPVDGSRYENIDEASAAADEKLDQFSRNLRQARDLNQDISDVLKSAMRSCQRSSSDTSQEQCPYCGEVQYDIKHEKPTTSRGSSGMSSNQSRMSEGITLFMSSSVRSVSSTDSMASRSSSRGRNDPERISWIREMSMPVWLARSSGVTRSSSGSSGSIAAAICSGYSEESTRWTS